MEEIILKANTRKVVGKQVKALRRAGQLPAVIYGRGKTPVAVTLDLHETSKLLPTITSSHLITLSVEGKPHTTLVREKQRHPVSGELIHVDFLEVSLTEKLRVDVIIQLEGDSPAVKNYNAVLVSGLEQLSIEAYPRDLPERISVDVSGLLEIGDAVYVRDLSLPSKVEVLSDPDDMIVLATAPVREEELVEEAAAEPEIIERGKKEEE
jgi:large subunit ribosomal protein L25